MDSFICNLIDSIGIHRIAISSTLHPTVTEAPARVEPSAQDVMQLAQWRPMKIRSTIPCKTFSPRCDAAVPVEAHEDLKPGPMRMRPNRRMLCPNAMKAQPDDEVLVKSGVRVMNLKLHESGD